MRGIKVGITGLMQFEARARSGVSCTGEATASSTAARNKEMRKRVSPKKEKFMSIHNLVKLGLTQNEASVYLASLELGSAKASEIAEKSKVSRALCYFLLSVLEKKGLVQESKQYRVKHFIAQDPRELCAFWKKKSQEYLKKSKECENKAYSGGALLADLTQFHDEKRRFRVSLFDGMDQLEIIRKYLFKMGTQIRTIFNEDDAMKEVPYHSHDTRYQLRDHPQPVLGILLSATRRGYKKDGAIRRYYLDSQISKKYGKFCEINISKDKIILMKTGELTHGIIIDDEQIANTLKFLFDLALKQIKQEMNNNHSSNSNAGRFSFS